MVMDAAICISSAWHAAIQHTWTFVVHFDVSLGQIFTEPHHPYLARKLKAHTVDCKRIFHLATVFPAHLKSVILRE